MRRQNERGLSLKLVVTADWHLRATRPRCRVDEDWYATQENALKKVGNVAIKNNCDVAVVGDIFNSNADTTFQCIAMVQKLASRLHEEGLSLYVLLGNHDLPYHSVENIERSAGNLLLGSTDIYPLSALPIDGVSAGHFGEETGDGKIIFKHVLCFPNEEDLPPDVDALCAKDLLEEYRGAKWIFTGDYHRNFHYSKGGRHVVNPGCLMRQAADMKEYKCGVYVVDIGEETVDFVEIEDKDCFVDDEYILKENEREERIGAFVDKLRETKQVSLDFIANVNKAIEENEIEADVRDVLLELVGG